MYSSGCNFVGGDILVLPRPPYQDVRVLVIRFYNLPNLRAGSLVVNKRIAGAHSRELFARCGFLILWSSAAPRVPFVRKIACNTVVQVFTAWLMQHSETRSISVWFGGACFGPFAKKKISRLSIVRGYSTHEEIVDKMILCAIGTALIYLLSITWQINAESCVYR